MEIQLQEVNTYIWNGRRLTFQEMNKLLTWGNKEIERNRIKCKKAYQRKINPVEPTPAINPVEPAPIINPVESQPFRTDHRGLIFPTTDENGRLLTYNGRPWVPIQIPKLS